MLPKNKSYNSTDTFIIKCIEKYGYLYDYSKVIYQNSKKDVIIICEKHGEFLQKPQNHLGKKSIGCPKCVYENKIIHAGKKFVEESNEKHNNKYTYEKAKYVKSSEKLIITCKKHGDFLQSPNNHLKGKGCKKCYTLKQSTNNNVYHNRKTYYNRKTSIYFILIDNKYYKIGLTMKDIKSRFSSDKNKIEVLFQEIFDNGVIAYDKEKYYLNKYDKYIYNGKKIIKSGNTEIFTENILKMEGVI